MKKVFSLSILICFFSACSVYKSQGRKSFEAKAEQNIPELTQKNCGDLQQTQKIFQSAQQLGKEYFLADVNIFGLQIYQSSTNANEKVFVDLQGNSCQVNSNSKSSFQEDDLMKNFHEMTNLSRE